MGNEQLCDKVGPVTSRQKSWEHHTFPNEKAKPQRSVSLALNHPPFFVSENGHPTYRYSSNLTKLKTKPHQTCAAGREKDANCSHLDFL